MRKLSPGLNRLIDLQAMGENIEQAQGRLHTGGFLTWGQPFVDLLDHGRIMPRLKVILGDGLSARPLLCDLPRGWGRAARVARRQHALMIHRSTITSAMDGCTMG